MIRLRIPFAAIARNEAACRFSFLARPGGEEMATRFHIGLLTMMGRHRREGLCQIRFAVLYHF